MENNNYSLLFIDNFIVELMEKKLIDVVQSYNSFAFLRSKMMMMMRYTYDDDQVKRNSKTSSAVAAVVTIIEMRYTERERDRG